MVLGTLLLLRVTPFGGIVDNEPGFLVSTAVALNMIAVFIAAAKGKMFMAVIGVFVPFFAIIGAIRLAEPGSMWAHYRYPKNSYKMKHAKLRKKRFEEKWLPRKDKIWDFIGGKPDRPLHHETKPDHL